MKFLILLCAGLGSAAPVAAQSLPDRTVGEWDISPDMCQTEDVSQSRITIKADRIDTYGGDAIVSEIETTGPVTYVAAQFRQTEGVETVGPRVLTHFRLTQRDLPDRLNFIWKDVTDVDLVRCDASPLWSTTGPDQSLLPVRPGL